MTYIIDNIGKIMRGIYINTRQGIRGFVIKHETLNRCLGNMLVKIDILIRKTGILKSELQKGYFEYNDFKVYFGKEDKDFVEFIITNNDYDLESREAIESILKKGDVFVDLGANIGFYYFNSSKFCWRFGKSFCF